MKKIPFLTLLGLLPLFSLAQTSKDYAVLLTASVQDSPASITLSWKADATSGVTYTVYRKPQGTNYWTDNLASLGNSADQYTDIMVQKGVVYEYWVKKFKSSLGTRSTADGYITAGIKVPDAVGRGKMILLVDQNYAAPLQADIYQLENDLIGDGWQLLRHDISRTASVSSVKQIIANDYNLGGVKALFILGRIPVPYSGGFKAASGFVYPPDGHPDHVAAWPADVYYGVMNESFWTDNQVSDSSGSRTQNWNKLGDGKFDQMYLYPDSCQLQIGRVDFSNMPAFSIGDTALTLRYLQKLHGFKTGMLKAERRGLVSDNFGAMGGEAFASSGWRAFSTMFGDSITEVGGSGQYFSAMRNNSYLWAYGTGGGTYTSAGGIGTTTDFVNDSLLNVFSMMFGSYFGDWDSQNNFLRAGLAHKGWTLSSSWSGRPYSIYHPMALGQTLGYCMQLSQNNLDGNAFLNPKVNSGYTQNSSPTFIHVALMGDPSLRMHPVLPVRNLSLNTINQQRHVVISWNSSLDGNITSYKILRASSRNGNWQLIATLNAGDSSFTDLAALDGLNYYMVRAIKLESSPSGSYYNPSIGVMDTISAKHYVGMPALDSQPGFSIYPNPASTVVYLQAGADGQDVELKIFDLNGRLLQTANWTQVQSTHQLQLNVANLKDGMYYLQVTSGGQCSTKKLAVLR